MNWSLKTSEANKKIVKELSPKFSVQTENIVARFALAYSLISGIDLKDSEPKDSDGKEYKEDALLGEYSMIYIAIICQKYNVVNEGSLVRNLIKLHLDHGLDMMSRYFASNIGVSGHEFIIDCISRSLAVAHNINHIDPSIYNSTPVKLEKKVFSEPIRIMIGYEMNNSKEVYVNINDSNLYSNFHIAIAGKPGSGKTSFAYKIISQLYKQSNENVNFIFLDFKGINSNPNSEQTSFFNSTKCTLVQVPEYPFPINPLSSIELVNLKLKDLTIRRFVDVVAIFGNLGHMQKHTLLQFTLQAFEKQNKTSHPTFQDIYNILKENYDKTDSLSSIIENLANLAFFNNETNHSSLLNKNYYVSLMPSLPEVIRITCALIIINYIYDIFMRMPDADNSGSNRGMRYILAIDEAHILFNDTKAQKLLDTILRMIRSKGVSVLLISQSINEFTSADSNPSSNCEISFVLSLADNNLRRIQKFLSYSDNEKASLAKNLNKMEKYQAISNIKELDKGSLISLRV